ncbi:MAG: hypothetical protein J6Q22_11105 [Prevotella sp.]|nr:hypothetical protein [Prevotella sp.]
MEQWTPTPAALALLKKLEDRKEAEKGIAVARRMTEEKQRKERQADENERKYGEQLTYADRLMERVDEHANNRYSAIEDGAGTNGNCTTRRGTYRFQKFGRGNIGKAGFERQGFKENQHQ